MQSVARKKNIFKSKIAPILGKELCKAQFIKSNRAKIENEQVVCQMHGALVIVFSL
ncbi:hypothetical protein GGU45_001673 [Niabella hirudinis]